MNYVNRSEQQIPIDEALAQLVHFFILEVEAEDANFMEEALLLHQECQRWGLIISILAVGVKRPRYADN